MSVLISCGGSGIGGGRLVGGARDMGGRGYGSRYELLICGPDNNYIKYWKLKVRSHKSVS